MKIIIIIISLLIGTSGFSFEDYKKESKMMNDLNKIFQKWRIFPEIILKKTIFKYYYFLRKKNKKSLKKDKKKLVDYSNNEIIKNLELNQKLFKFKEEKTNYYYRLAKNY